MNIHGTIQTWKRCSYFPFEFYSWPSFNPEKRIVKPAYGSKQNGDSKLHSDLAARQLGKPVPRSYFRHPFFRCREKGIRYSVRLIYDRSFVLSFRLFDACSNYLGIIEEKRKRWYNELKGRRSVKINKDIVSWKIYRVIIFELKSNTTRKKISVLRRKKYYYEYFFPLESTCFSLSLSLQHDSLRYILSETLELRVKYLVYFFLQYDYSSKIRGQLLFQAISPTSVLFLYLELKSNTANIT